MQETTLLKTIEIDRKQALERDEQLDILISTERDRSLKAEKILDTKIDAEIKRATETEVGLRTDLNSEITRSIEADIALQKAIEDEAATRLSEDISIRNYIDEHIAEVDLRTDVVDVVATKAELSVYDISKITENDIIKVLADETSLEATTYYRLVENEFILVGKVGPYYTKAEINAQTRYLRDEDINFAGTKDFNHITSSQVPQVDSDLTNKLYVDTNINEAKERAKKAEEAISVDLQNEITRASTVEDTISKNLSDEIARAVGVESNLTENLSNLSSRVDSKADLVDGKIPNSQLPEFFNIICEV